MYGVNRRKLSGILQIQYCRIIMGDKVLLGHGSGGKLSHQLIQEIFLSKFPNNTSQKDNDSAFLQLQNNRVGFTTDSYVVNPLFFPGGDIGKLAVSGTVNDLAVSGFVPKYLSIAFIIEEGFPINDLKKIVESICNEAEKAAIQIVTGDTKVVNRGSCDGVFINTAGVGELHASLTENLSFSNIQSGDSILLTGSIAEHGMAVMATRENIKIDNLESDVAPLNHMLLALLDQGIKVKFMRDATRGGIATVLKEINLSTKLGIEVHESNIPVEENVRSICEILGFDLMYVANEGKALVVVDEFDTNEALKILNSFEEGKKAAKIGSVSSTQQHAVLHTSIGGKRIIDMLAGEQLPRIC
jgi:hydrogenase expression/formation protein HypE